MSAGKSNNPFPQNHNVITKPSKQYWTDRIGCRKALRGDSTYHR